MGHWGCRVREREKTRVRRMIDTTAKEECDKVYRGTPRREKNTHPGRTLWASSCVGGVGAQKYRNATFTPRTGGGGEKEECLRREVQRRKKRSISYSALLTKTAESREGGGVFSLTEKKNMAGQP